MSVVIYFITAPEVARVKIGGSCDIGRRLRDLRRTSPVRLELVAFLEIYDGDGCGRYRWRQVERRFHERHFDAIDHDEWFFLTAAIKADIAAIQAGAFDVEALPAQTVRTWRGNSDAVREGKRAAKAGRKAA